MKVDENSVKKMSAEVVEIDKFVKEKLEQRYKFRTELKKISDELDAIDEKKEVMLESIKIHQIELMKKLKKVKDNRLVIVNRSQKINILEAQMKKLLEGKDVDNSTTTL